MGQYEADKSFVLLSHERCRSMGIDTRRVYSKKIINGDELQKKIERSKELILTATPFMNQLYNSVKGSNFFAILTDEDGCILNVIGDDEILSEAFKFKMLPGAYLDEENIGTNAMSIVLSEGSAVQISGEEHYINAYHKWTCSAAPIKNADNKLIGVLDLTGNCLSVHPHTLGMVVAASNAIEQMLKIKKYNSKLEIANKHTETIMNSISSGILTSDLSGRIGMVNEYLCDMFGFSKSEMEMMNVRDLFKGFEVVVERLNSNQYSFNEDVYVNARKNKLQFNLNAYPVYDLDRKVVEIIYIFVEIQKTRKYAGKILSGRAVYTFDKIIGKNEGFLNTIEYSKKISDSKSTILITGESGTGKEVFAQSIHNYSSRRDEPFIAVNCGAIPRDLIESELFGYEEGAFTGARKGGYSGKFEIANEGTLFLDEIGEMPSDMQVKLLRVIEEGIINRIGCSKQIPVNVRIIAATNKDLKDEVQKGNFRKDLFYRLNVLPIYLTPLRKRRDDIPLLIEYFVNKISKHLNKKTIDIPDHYIEYLKKYDWQGNIRELENVIELVINTGMIPMNYNINNYNVNIDSIEEINTSLNGTSLKLEYVERQHITRVLGEFNGNISLAAKALDIGRNTLYRKIAEYKIDCSIMDSISSVEQEKSV